MFYVGSISTATALFRWFLSASEFTSWWPDEMGFPTLRFVVAKGARKVAFVHVVLAEDGRRFSEEWDFSIHPDQRSISQVLANSANVQSRPVDSSSLPCDHKACVH